MDEVSRNAEEIREGARVGESGFRVVRGAEVRPSFAAASAVAAGAKALCYDRVPFGDVLDVGPDRFDQPCPLVARDDRIAHVARRPATLEDLDVRAADACSADADEDLAGTGLRSRYVLQCCGSRPLDDDRTHLTAHGGVAVDGSPLRSHPSLKRKIPVCVRGCSAQAS